MRLAEIVRFFNASEFFWKNVYFENVEIGKGGKLAIKFVSNDNSFSEMFLAPPKLMFSQKISNFLNLEKVEHFLVKEYLSKKTLLLETCIRNYFIFELA